MGGAWNRHRMGREPTAGYPHADTAWRVGRAHSISAQERVALDSHMPIKVDVGHPLSRARPCQSGRFAPLLHHMSSLLEFLADVLASGYGPRKDNPVIRFFVVL